MQPSSSRKRQWELTPEAFRGLLAFLDPDPQCAAERYEKVREKLTRFFEWKGCIPGDEYADETIDRVARRLEDGMETPPAEPYLYFHGIAVNVVRERWRKADREPERLPMEYQGSVVHPFEAQRSQDAALERERRLECLQDCIGRLPPVSRELLIAYHLGGSALQIGRRKSLADRLNIPAAALRLRLHRIRKQLESCVSRCLSARSKEDAP